MTKKIFITLGWIATIIILIGATQQKPYPYYFSGAVVLLATAIYFKLIYFISLQVIITAGHLSTILLDSAPHIQFFLPVLLCLQLLIFYIMYGKDNSFFLVLGILGIAFLSTGFSYNNQWIFLSGSLCVAIYAYYISSIKKFYPAYIWVTLNTGLALITLYKIFVV